jgi:hypothetical protein
MPVNFNHRIGGNMPAQTESSAPVRKVTAAGIAGAASTVLVFAVNRFLPGVTIPPAISAALTTAITFVTGYVTSPGEKDSVVTTDPQ